ncbi:unnamed protein product [Gongylonema pulchrum]|uniref:Uncharacterized protein n=1 Tax=Gongylonema pulchrum TaxID=637853 RepID=A0A183D3C1_9BILA|nr:unnamed protein product [Gongylonema pulchrum]
MLRRELSKKAQRCQASPIRSPSGPMSPRSSVYRTKPVIHADLSGASPRPQAPVNAEPAVFEFPPSKQLTELIKV